MKARVPQWHGKPNAFVTVDTEATKGATVGLNLYWPDGTVVVEADFNPASDDDDSVGVTVWRLILEIPPHVTALAETTTTGIYVITDANSSATRTLADSTTIGWTNPDGVAGNPSAAFIGDTDDVPEGATNLYFTDERAQDAVGAILVGTGDVPLVYVDGTPSIGASLATAQGAAHTWAVTQTFTLAPVFTDAAGTRAALGLGNVENTALSTWAGSANLTTLGTIATGVWNATAISLANGGTGAALVDPGADRLMFWDDSAGAVDWLTLGTNLSITGTTLNATGGGGSTPTGTGFRHVTSGVEDAAAKLVEAADIPVAEIPLDRLVIAPSEGFAGAPGPGSYTHLSAANARTLLNVADGATANSTDAFLLDRANHTGTQTMATISDLPTQGSGGVALTITNGANVATSASAACYYHREGDNVFVFGRVTVDPTAANTITVLGLSLPIASNFTTVNQLTGTGVHHQAGGVGVENHSAVSIYSHVIGNRAELTWYPSQSSNGILRFNFAYEII